MGFIYKVTNKVNGKIYIGQTCRTINARWSEHLRDAFSKTGKRKFIIHSAIKKYGADAFSIEQIEECPNAELDSRERYWINFYDSHNHGYNVDLGGKGSKGQPIYQYAMDGTFIRRFETTEEARASIGNKVIIISNNKPNASNGGYLWRRYKTDRLVLNRKRYKGQVHQYTIDGEYIQSFKRIMDASKACGAASCTLIGQVCKGEKRIAFGYRWSYEKVDHLQEIVPAKRFRKVLRISPDGKERLYNTIVEAAKDNGLNASNITMACKGRLNTSGGYHWKYYDEQNAS